jgi:flagellar biosynthetic protein FliR
MAELLRHIGEQHLAGFILVLARLSPLFLVAPLFSSPLIPARARGVIAVALAIGITPLAMRNRPLPLDAMGLGALAIKEILIGLAFAFTVAAVFAALQVAGSIADTMVGFSFAGVMDPITGNHSAMLANVYALVGTMIFIAIGGDGWLAQGIARTYELVPLDRAPDIGALVAGADSAFGGVLLAALEVVAPVLLAVLLADIAFGLVSRVVPQLNAFAVAFPAKIAIGLLVFAAALPFAGTWLGDQLQGSVGDALRTLRAVPGVL